MAQRSANMDDEGSEQPFLPLDRLLEVSVVEDGNDNTQSEEVSNNETAQGVVNDSLPSSDQQEAAWTAAQMAWGMDPEEDTFYNELFKDVSSVRYLRVHCTVCDVHLGCAPGTMLMRHVRLGTLMCKDCFQFYGTGEFTIAYDGSESYCCWCGQGGSVICCSNCSAVFCKKCIKQNFTTTILKEIEACSEWLCFVCNYRSLWEHRAVCRAAITFEASNYNSLQEDGKNGKNAICDSPDECCSSEAQQRRPRLKSSMPYEVTFGNYIKSGIVKMTVSKMLKKSAVKEDSNGTTPSDLIEIIDLEESVQSSSDNITSSTIPEEATNSHKTETKPHADINNKILKSPNSDTVEGLTPLRVIQKPLVGGKTGNTVSKSTTNVPTLVQQLTSDSSLVNLGTKVVTSGIRVVNSSTKGLKPGTRVNIVCDNKLLQHGRVVVMPPIHLPAQSSAARVVGGSVRPQKTSLVAVPLIPVQGTHLNNSGQTPVYHLLDQNLVVVSSNSTTTNLPFIVNSNATSYTPSYVNSTGSLLNAPSMSTVINGVSGVQLPLSSESKNITGNAPLNSAVANQTVEQLKTSFRNIVSSSVLLSDQQQNQTANFVPSTPVCSVGSQTSQTIPSYTSANIKSNLQDNRSLSATSVNSTGFIRVRSPSALQSVGVSDIHYPVAAGNVSSSRSERDNSVQTSCSPEFVTSSGLKPNKEPTPNSLLFDSLCGIKRKQKDDLSSEQIVCPSSSRDSMNSMAINNQQTPVPQVIRQCKSHSLLKSTIIKENCSNKFPTSVSTVKGVMSQKKDLGTSPIISSSKPSENESGRVNLDEFRKNLLEGENLAKYVLTRITCLQEQLENKANKKIVFDDMVNHFSKLLEIAKEKLTKVTKNFNANRRKWKNHSRRSPQKSTEAECSNSETESDVEMNLQFNTEIQSNSPSDSNLTQSPASNLQEVCVSESNERNRLETSRMNLRTYRPPSLKKLDALSVDMFNCQGNPSKKIGKRMSTSKNRTLTQQSRIIRSSTTRVSRSNTNSHSKVTNDRRKRKLEIGVTHERFRQNVNSSCDTSEIQSEDERGFEVLEKRRKMKEVKIVLERINVENNITIKKEMNEPDISLKTSSHDIVDSKLVAKFSKLIKPCSVVLHRLNVKSHSIL